MALEKEKNNNKKRRTLKNSPSILPPIFKNQDLMEENWNKNTENW